MFARSLHVLHMAAQRFCATMVSGSAPTDVLAMLRECAHRRHRLPVPYAVWIAAEVVDALDFAHNQTDAAGKALVVRAADALHNVGTADIVVR